MWRAFLQQPPQILHKVPTTFGMNQLMIPDSFHQNSPISKKLVTVSVVFPLVGNAVTETIQLDCEPRFVTEEVEIVVSFKSLSAEFVSCQSARTDQPPETPFCPRGLLA
jgi:hypothetical protein